MKEVEVDPRSLRCPIVKTSKVNSKAKEFLAEAGQFHLGGLPTETRHPKSMKLSQLAQTDLPAAIRIFNEVDRQAVMALDKVIGQLKEMTSEIRETLASGGRIFLCGCGATGRLSVSLEAIWREEVLRQGRPDLSDKVFSFIAGGDFALVRSIENFEDHPEFGVRQLLDLGFKAGDLLISCTEGGETPFVIGATEAAAGLRGRKPFFLFCNPAEILRKTAERSKKVIDNPEIRKIELATGPMILSGSTRLQATTVQQLAVGAALFASLSPEGNPASWIEEFKKILTEIPFQDLAPLIENEASVYQSGEICVHRTDRFGITVLTDTTERTPTFSLLPFESDFDIGRPPSWTHLSLVGVFNSQDAWSSVLGRPPRSLDWADYKQQFGIERTLAYDFSEQSLVRRQKTKGLSAVKVFEILDRGSSLYLSIGHEQVYFPMPVSLLAQHLLVKCAMNITSTLLMGRLGRFLGNVMVYVRPTNKKLIDRSIRYIQMLLQDEGLNGFTYEQICSALFDVFETASEEDPVVLLTYNRLKETHGN